MTAFTEVTVLFATAVLGLVLTSTAIKAKSFAGQNALSLISRGYVAAFRSLVSRGVTINTLLNHRRRIVCLVNSLSES